VGSTSIVSMLRTAVVVCALVSPCSGLKFASTGLNYASTGRASSAVAFLSPTTFDAVSESRIHGDADAFFDKVDDDGNGQISFDELTEHLTAMGFQPSGIDHIFDVRVKRSNSASASHIGLTPPTRGPPPRPILPSTASMSV
jgi:hypothetical protein